MQIKTFAALLLGKAILKTTQILKIGGGSAAPGLYALKIDPNLVSNLANKIPKSVVVTGTNGKTTTSRMLAHFAQSQGLKIIRNSTGSNLERGVASTLIAASNLSKYDLAVWELDEAAFNNVVPKLNPDIIVFLNVFRDQLDRYGEVDSVVKKWCQTLKQLSNKTHLFINGDDHNLLELKDCFKGKVTTFGVENYKIRGENSYKKVGQEKLDFEANNITLLGFDGVQFELKEGKDLWHFLLPLPGIYHIYDFLAAYLTSLELSLDRQSIIKSLQTFTPAFGRVEKFTLQNNIQGYILLIKNPTGTTQVIETLKSELKPNDRLLLALNDNFADGRDVSWIWDANFEEFQLLGKLRVDPEQSRMGQNSSGAQSRDYHIICSGTRAHDLALRLKYAGASTNNLIIEKSLEKAFLEAQNGLSGRLFIMPTYTAMLELQRILTKHNIKKHYWSENQ